MIRFFKGVIQYIVARPAIRISLQVLTSAVILLVLINMAQSANVLEGLRLLSPEALGIAICCYLAGYALNSLRWKLLLQYVGVSVVYIQLIELYFIGLFCSLFLPTGTGGDAVRIYQVARRSGMPAQTLLATVQERFLGLGMTVLIGSAATFYYLPLIPEQLRFWVIICQFFALVLVVMLLYPAIIFTIVRHVWRNTRQIKALAWITRHRIIAKVIAATQPLISLPQVTGGQLILLMIVTFTASMLGIAGYAVLGQSLGMGVSFFAYCLVVPLVWIARMAPISLGGVGVGEGAFVFLMALFSVSTAHALTLALAMLCVMTGTSLIGGLLMAIRMLQGAWSDGRAGVRVSPENSVTSENS